MVRQHEEFIWLHDSFVENEEYAGFIVSTAKTIEYIKLDLRCSQPAQFQNVLAIMNLDQMC